MPFLGVTYYPELWTKEDNERAFQLIKDAGFDVVRMGEMSWGQVEKKPNSFDFSFLDQAFSLAQKHQLKILLGIATSYAPAWLIFQHPEFRPVSHEGLAVPENGPRPNVCRDNPLFYKYAKRYADKIISRYAKNPALFAWQLDNEPTYPPLDATETKDYCHCFSTQALFVNWLNKRYKKIDKLNAAWGTSFWGNYYSSFKDIHSPKQGFWEASNPHAYLDWYFFKSERISEWLCQMKAWVQAKDKLHEVGTNGFIGPVSRVLSHDVLASGMQWYGWDIYPHGTLNTVESLAQQADFWRSLCQRTGARFIVAELQAGKNVRWGYGGEVSGRQIYLWMHQLAARGAEGILLHALRAPLFGSEAGGFGLLSLSGEKTERYEEAKRAIAEIKKINSCLSLSKINSRVAILYIKSAEVMTFQEEGPSRGAPPKWFSGRYEMGAGYNLNSLAGAYRLAWNYLGSADFLCEKDLLNGNIKKYSTLLVVNPYVFSEDMLKALQEFMEQGGQVVCEARLGHKDFNGKLFPLPLAEKFLDFKYIDTEILEEKKKITTLPAISKGFREKVASGHALFSFDDGYPALIEKTFGRGKILYATFSLFLNLLEWEARAFIPFLREYLPQPEISVKAEREVDWILREGEKPLLYLINASNEERHVSIQLPQKYHKALELLPEGDCKINFHKVELRLTAFAVKILQFI